MISERTFARSFTSFWEALLPLMTPGFVHVINEQYKERVTDDFGLFLAPIERRVDSNSAVIAEFAFYLAKNAFEASLSIKEAYDDVGTRNQAVETAIRVVSYYEDAIQYPITELRNDELQEGYEIAQNYQRFLKQVPVKGTVEFLPTILGAGFVQNCQADLAIGTALFEVKTVSRNLASRDIKQLIVYLALQAATGNRKWTLGGFFNPRKPEYVQFPVDEVLARISGGRSSSEVYHTLIEFVSSSVVQFDTAF